MDPRLVHPDASPLHADLRRMPRGLICAGGEHGFNLFSMPRGAAALRRSEAFLAETLTGETK